MDWLKKNRVVVILAGVVLIAVLLYGNARKGAVEVRAEAVTEETIQNTITTNGKVEPQDNFQAHAVGPAAVRRIYVKEGDAVKAGQMLVQLDDSEARAAAARALAQVKSAEADLSAVRKGGTQDEVLSNQSALIKAMAERESADRGLTALRKLRENGSASVGEVEAGENRLKSAQAEVDLLQKRRSGRYSNPEIARAVSAVAQAKASYIAAEDVLKNVNIAAPRAGTVYSLPVRQGGFVNAGDLIVQVADLSKMQVRAFVDEPDIGKLAKGQRVELKWDAIPGRTWEGTVSSTPTTVIMRGTRNVGEVVCSVDNRERKLLPNVNVDVQIVTAKAEHALTISREAVLQENGQRFVFAIQDGHLVRTQVETGISNLTRIQIIKGVAGQTRLALGAVNSQPLSDKQAVRIVE